MVENVKRTITIVGASSGLDKLAADVDKVGAAQTRAANAEKSTAVIRDNVGRATAGLTARVEAYTRANDALTKAYAQVARGEALRNSQLAAGLSITAGFERAQATARARVEELMRATHGHTESMVLNRMQMMESMHVMKSLADSIIAGQSPLRALSMEGGRIAEIFAEGQGGVGGTLKAMGGIVARLATGWVGLGLGIAGSLALAGGAVMRFLSQQDRLALSLQGAGRASGLSLGGLTSIANNAAATTSGMSQGTATGLAAGFAHAGLSGGIIQSAMGLTSSYSNATGQDLSKSGEELAKALSDPAKGADELNSKLGFLDDTTRQLIESMARSGNTLGAQALLLDKVAAATKNAADQRYWYTRAYQGAVGAVGTGLDAIGTLGQAGPLEQQVAQKTRQLSDLQGPLAFRDSGSRGDQIRILVEEIAKLNDAIREQNKQTAADAKTQAEQKLSLQAGDAVRSLIPELKRQQELVDQIALLTGAQGVSGAPAQTGRARGIAQTLLANSDPMERMAQDNALDVAAARATTLAQKEMIDARKAELAVLRQSGYELLAVVAAEGKRNEMLAAAQKEIDDATRNARRDLGYAHMTPYEAAHARVNDEMLDFNKTHAGGASGPVSSIPFSAYTAQVAPGSIDAAAANRMIDNYVNHSNDVDSRATILKTIRDSQIGGGGASSAVAAATRTSVPLAPANSNNRGGTGYVGNTSAMASAKNDLVDVRMMADPLKEANTALAAQSALLTIQANAGNLSAAAIQGLLERQKLINEYTKEGVTDLSSYSSSLDAFQKKAAAAAQAQEDLQKKIQALDTVRSDANSGLHAFVDDLVAGKNAAFAFRDAMEQLGKKILSSGLDSVTSMLLGKQGTTGTGLLGGLFGGGGVGTFSNGFGAAPTFGGGIGGIIGHLLGFANGGVMTPNGPLALPRFAGGGTSNTAAIFGESGPEAAVPLPDGRSIPVAFKGGSGGVTIGGHTIVVQGNADNKAIAQMKAELAQANKQQLSSLQRNTGQMQARWAQRYG